MQVWYFIAALNEFMLVKLYSDLHSEPKYIYL